MSFDPNRDVYFLQSGPCPTWCRPSSVVTSGKSRPEHRKLGELQGNILKRFSNSSLLGAAPASGEGASGFRKKCFRAAGGTKIAAQGRPRVACGPVIVDGAFRTWPAQVPTKKVEFPENEALVLEPMVVYISIYTSEHTGGYQNDFTNIF